MKLFINEDKFSAAMFSKKAVEQLLMFLKVIISKPDFLSSYHITAYEDGKDVGNISMRVNTKGKYFRGGILRQMPDFYLILKDNLDEYGKFKAKPERGSAGYFQIILRMDGYVKKHMDSQISAKELFAQIKSRKDTLVHEMSHFYDYIINKNRD